MMLLVVLGISFTQFSLIYLIGQANYVDEHVLAISSCLADLFLERLDAM